jgi:hypothetical protein
VVLPAPDGPIKAIFFPLGNVNETLSNTFCAVPGY